FFFLSHMPTTAVSNLSLHDALPIFTVIFLRAERSFRFDNNNHGRLYSIGKGIFKCYSSAFWNDIYVYYYSDWSFSYGLENGALRSEEHTSELQSRFDLVCRLLLEKK